MFNGKGGVITVVGLFGSGKSSLLAGLKEDLGDVTRILKTYTTRPRREGESNNGEYIFVSEEEYLQAAEQSCKWYERQAAGHRYGQHVSDIEEGASAGHIYLATMLPHKDTLISHKETFGCNVLQILINVSEETCNERLLQRSEDASQRIALHRMLSVSDCVDTVDGVFIPQGSFEDDRIRFTQYIKTFLT